MEYGSSCLSYVTELTAYNVQEHTPTPDHTILDCPQYPGFLLHN